MITTTISTARKVATLSSSSSSSSSSQSTTDDQVESEPSVPIFMKQKKGKKKRKTVKEKKRGRLLAHVRIDKDSAEMARRQLEEIMKVTRDRRHLKLVQNEARKTQRRVAEEKKHRELSAKGGRVVVVSEFVSPSSSPSTLSLISSSSSSSSQTSSLPSSSSLSPLSLSVSSMSSSKNTIRAITTTTTTTASVKSVSASLKTMTPDSNHNTESKTKHRRKSEKENNDVEREKQYRFWHKEYESLIPRNDNKCRLDDRVINDYLELVTHGHIGPKHSRETKTSNSALVAVSTFVWPKVWNMWEKKTRTHPTSSNTSNSNSSGSSQRTNWSTRRVGRSDGESDDEDDTDSFCSVKVVHQHRIFAGDPPPPLPKPSSSSSSSSSSSFMDKRVDPDNNINTQSDERRALLFLPIHLNGNHWSAMTIDFGKRTLVYSDSRLSDLDVVSDKSTTGDEKNNDDDDDDEEEKTRLSKFSALEKTKKRKLHPTEKDTNNNNNNNSSSSSSSSSTKKRRRKTPPSHVTVTTTIPPTLAAIFQATLAWVSRVWKRCAPRHWLAFRASEWHQWIVDRDFIQQAPDNTVDCGVMMLRLADKSLGNIEDMATLRGIILQRLLAARMSQRQQSVE